MTRLFENDPEDITAAEILAWCDEALERAELRRDQPGLELGPPESRLSLEESS